MSEQLTYESALHIAERVFHKVAVKEYCDAYKIKGEQFRIVLLTEFKNDVGIIGGPVIQVVLPWADKSITDMTTMVAHIGKLKTRVNRALRYIHTHGLLDTFAIDSVIHTLDNKIWKRQPFDDLCEVATELLPFKQFRKSRVHSITMTHKDTGLSHTITDNGNRSEWDMEQECRLELSRHVVEAYRVLEETRLKNMRHVALVPMSYYEETKNELAAMWECIKDIDSGFGTEEAFIKQWSR